MVWFHLRLRVLDEAQNSPALRNLTKNCILVYFTFMCVDLYRSIHVYNVKIDHIIIGNVTSICIQRGTVDKMFDKMTQFTRVYCCFVVCNSTKKRRIFLKQSMWRPNMGHMLLSTSTIHICYIKYHLCRMNLGYDVHGAL